MIVFATALWTTMKERGVSQYKLIKEYKMSTGQLGQAEEKRECKHLHARPAMQNIELRPWRISRNTVIS